MDWRPVRLRLAGTIYDSSPTNLNIQWKLPKNETISTMENNHYFESPPFYFRSERWSFRLYANGDKESKGHVTVHLVIESNLQNSLRLRIALKLRLDNEGEIEDITKIIPLKFRNRLQRYRWKNILKLNAGYKNKLNKSVITISCFAILNFPLPFYAYPSTCERTKMSRDFEKMFNDEEDTDVTFDVQGKKFKAHKFILETRSAKFKKMFETNVGQDCFEITDCSEPDVFDMLLRFLYSGTVKPFSDLIAIRLYPVAHEYCSDLARVCAEVLADTLNPDTFRTIERLARKYRVKLLLDAIGFVIVTT